MYRIVEHACRVPGLKSRSMVIWWKVPVFWRWISWARVPTVYLKDDDPFTKIHELVHVPQVYRYGAFHWIIGHLFDKEFRLKCEAPATAARIKAMVDTGGYEPSGLISYYAALYPRAYRLGTKWSTEELESILWTSYNLL